MTRPQLARSPMTRSGRRAAAFAAGLALLLPLAAFPGAAAAQTFVKAQTSSAGGTPFIVMTTLATVVQQNDPGVRIQISAGKAFPPLTADLANGRSDLVTTSPVIVHYMQNRQEMFGKLADAPEKAGNLRNIMAYPLGQYHFVVRADSGIRELKDLKGKRVFAGPRTAGAAVYATEIIRAETGLEPDKDYEMVPLDWASGGPAFQDRQVDVFVRPGNAPMPLVKQFALTDRIRLLDIKDETLADPELRKAILALPGRTPTTLSPDAYGENQANEKPVSAVMSWGSITTRAGMDADIVYRITKAVWENIDEFRSAASWMKQIGKETAFAELNVPLHVGAYRYYKEAGFDVPEDLVPPEAK